ncbi:MAG: non-heme iron oxygenase ferredoxin subunit [Nitrososphaerales archaeon]|nr:non-heme iron oxygenase ferredoxin subunit [Nitrososphaerales archaeon]
MAEFVPAMRFDDLSEGSMATVDVNGTHVLLSKIGGEVHALSGTCTHEEADLGLGMMLEGSVVCPLHLSQFDLRSGQVMNPPATVPLQVFNVKIQDGTIFLEV